MTNAVARALSGIGGWLLLTGAWATDLGDAFPLRPITMIVPFAAGGPTDTVARVVGADMAKSLGQQIVIENVVGAGGMAATLRAMHAPADGYTIEFGHTGTHAAVVALDPNLAYDPSSDFAPIGLSTGMPMLILGRKGLPVHTIGQFAAYARAAGGRLNMGHAGVASVSLSTCLLLNSILDIKPTLVPYNGTGPALNALTDGQVDYMCDQVASVAGSGLSRVQVFAVTTPVRSSALPTVPTTREVGLPQVEVLVWNALFAPKGTPQRVLDRLSAALDHALSDPGTRKRLTELGCEIPGRDRRGQRALAGLVRADMRHWRQMLRGVALPH